MAKKKKSAEFNRILLYGMVIIAVVLMGYYGHKSISSSSATDNVIDGEGISNGIIHPDVSVLLDPTSPVSSIVLSGTNGNSVASFRFRAVGEAFTVKTLALLIPESKDVAFGIQTNWSSVKNLAITYSNKAGQLVTKTQAVSAPKVKFTNLDLYVPKNSIATMLVKTDFYDINTGPAKFGDRIKIVFVSGAVIGSGDFYAVSETTNTTDQRAAVKDISANEHVLYKSQPVITQVTTNISTVLVPGATNVLYKFTVSADSHGPIALKRLTFAITVINPTTSSAADLGGFIIMRDGVDVSADNTANGAQIDGAPGFADNTSPVARVSMEIKGIQDIEANSNTTWVFINFGKKLASDPTLFVGEQIIPAGVITNWSLQAVAGSGFSTGGMVTTELLGDADLPKLNTYSLADFDVTWDEYAIILGKTSALLDSTARLVWSDNSAIMHAAALYDNTGPPPLLAHSSKDWTNSKLVKNFGTSQIGSWTLTL